MTYAEPELVTGLQGYSGGPLMGSGGPVGPGVIGMSGPISMPNSRYVGIGSTGSGHMPGTTNSGPGSHYSSSLLSGPSKFNTIHSSVNKRSNSSAGVSKSNYFFKNIFFKKVIIMDFFFAKFLDFFSKCFCGSRRLFGKVIKKMNRNFF